MVKMERKIREIWGERIELGGLLSTPPAAVPGAQANLTYMYQHSHIPVSQLSPCGYIHLRVVGHHEY